jgi:hypothetical protein
VVRLVESGEPIRVGDGSKRDRRNVVGRSTEKVHVDTQFTKGAGWNADPPETCFGSPPGLSWGECASSQAASRNRWEFLLMVTPLALPNAHRIAPVNLVAMF